MNERVSRLGITMKRATWLNFRWDFLSALSISFFGAVFNQFYVPMAIRHGASNLQVGLLTAAPAIGLLFSPLWAGLVSGRAPKPFVVYPNLIARLSLVVVAIWQTPWVFVGTALFVNVLTGITAPAYAALVTRMYPAALRGRLMGYVRVALSVVVIPMAYAIGQWIDTSGDRGPLLVAAAAGVLSIALFSPVKEVEPPATDADQPRRPNLRQQWTVLQGNSALVVFLIATTFAGFGNLLANPLYQIYQVHRLDLDNVQIAATRVAYYTCLLIGYFVMGWVIDRYSPRRAMVVGIGAYAITPLFYSLWGTYDAVIAASGFQALGDATWDIGCMSYVFKVAPGREAVVFGLHLMLFGVRGTLAPLLATGFSHALSLGVILTIASLCGWIGFAIFGWAILQDMAKTRTAGLTGIALEHEVDG